ncbi:hypothetical protein R1flu_020586 [Riccia fluitans]|uniref:Uncharacterized protein n=1 Tax=Riccia fluitans TaxID=41844 RepID=A0ABD1ZM60_9MARC
MPPSRTEPLPKTSNGEELEDDRGDDGGERGTPIEDDVDESDMAIDEESSSSVPRANNESIPSSPANLIEGAAPFVEARSGAENVDTKKEARTNSGKKRKKNCSKSATMLVDVLERMSQNNVFVIQEVEKGRITREDARNKLLSQLEQIRFPSDWELHEIVGFE